MRFEWAVAVIVTLVGGLTAFAAGCSRPRRGIAAIVIAGALLALLFVVLGSLRLALIEVAVTVCAGLVLGFAASSRRGAVVHAAGDGFAGAAAFLVLGLFVAIAVRVFGMAASDVARPPISSESLPEVKPAAVIGVLVVMFAALLGSMAAIGKERR